MKGPFPTEVKVGALTYTIEALPEDIARDADLYGDVVDRYCKIRIDFSLDRHVVADTLIHEIMHVIWDAYEISHKDKEERIVRPLATGFAAVLHDNPKLARWILRALK
jgi:hypothetical protein